MELALGMWVSRKDMHGDHWSTPFLIDTPEKLKYHNEFIHMNYKYKEVV